MNKPPKKLFYCTYCDKGLSSKYSLKNHEKKLHEDKKSEKCLKNQSENLNEPKTCTICKIEFTKNVHERCFTQYPYPCNFCNSWLKTEELKHVHELIHQLKRCGYCFRDIKTTDFDQHVLTCQNDLVLKQYREENELSNEQFMEREKLLEPTTQIPHPQPSTPTFSCSTCKKVFLSNNVLKKHIDIVHEAKPKITLQHSEPSGFPVIPSEKDLTNFNSSQLRGILNEVRKHYHNSIIFMDCEYPEKAQYYKDCIEKLEKKIESYENPRILQTLLQNDQPAYYFEEVIIQPQEMSFQCELCADEMTKEKDFFEKFTGKTQIQIQYLCPHQIDSTIEFHEEKKPSESTELNSVQLEAEKQFVGQRKKAFQCKFCEASYDTAAYIEEHFNSCHEYIQVEVHEEKKLNEKYNKIKRRFDVEVGLLRRLHERSYLKAKQAADIMVHTKSHSRVSLLAEKQGANEIIVIETKFMLKVENTDTKRPAEETTKQPSKKRKKEVGLLRKLQEKSYLQAKHTAAIAQELPIVVETVHERKKQEFENKENKENIEKEKEKLQQPATNDSATENVVNVNEKCRKKKSYDCLSCGKKFTQSSNLCQHISAVHEKKTPFKCELCDRSFKAKAVLMKHHRSIHVEPKVIKEKISYDCIHCEKKFNRSNNLKQHVSAVHEEKKPFKCELCDASFKAKAPLNNHQSSFHHSKPMPFTCKHCKEGFTRKDRWQKHEIKCSELDPSK